MKKTFGTGRCVNVFLLLCSRQTLQSGPCGGGSRCPAAIIRALDGTSSVNNSWERSGGEPASLSGRPARDMERHSPNKRWKEAQKGRWQRLKRTPTLSV